MTNTGFIAYIVSWLAVTVGVFTIFEKASDSLKDGTKKDISEWLTGISIEGPKSNWPETFAATFDAVFTRRHLSWTCFWRSCLASLIAVYIVTAFLAAFGADTLWDKNTDPVVYWVSLPFFVFVLGGILNTFPDYLSLLETRAIIKLMSKRRGLFDTTMLLLLDFVATNAIFILGFYAFYWAVWAIAYADYAAPTVSDNIGFHLQGLGLSRPTGPTGRIFIYSTFLTSVWVWLYAISGFLMAAINRSKAVLDFCKEHLAIEERPLRSMATIIVIGITICYLVGGVYLTLK